jgi:hypothetical protein
LLSFEQLVGFLGLEATRRPNPKQSKQSADGDAVVLQHGEFIVFISQPAMPCLSVDCLIGTCGVSLPGY